MNTSAQYELVNIKNELANIIDELKEISSGVRNDFTGIGNELCSNCIDKVIEKYTWVLRKLGNIDTSKVTEEYAAAHPVISNT